MNNKKVKWIVRLGLLFIILAILLVKPIYNSFTNYSSWSNNEHADYRLLFKNEVLPNLQFTSTIESNTREPESFYCYNNDFNILVTKIHVVRVSDWRNLIKINKTALTMDYG